MLAATNHLRTLKCYHLMQLADKIEQVQGTYNNELMDYMRTYAGAPPTPKKEPKKILPLSNIVKKELCKYANILEDSLQSAIVTHISGDNASTPAISYHFYKFKYIRLI